MLQIIHSPVSENISRFAWYGEVLYIEFKKTHDVYRYLEVPEATFREMCQASSVGCFFHAFIRKAFTDCMKLTLSEARALGFEEQVTNEV